MTDLPFIDEHSRRVDAPMPDTWAAALAFATRLADGDERVLGRLLGTEPASGFAVAEVVERELIALEGGHRFARYRAEFRVEPLDGASLVRIRTLAEFPGVKGRAYRALVIGSRGHVVAIRWFLNRVERQASRSSTDRTLSSSV